MQPPVTAKVDTTQFDAAMALYLKETSKTVVDAVNIKLYDAARAAIKGTTAAKANNIRSALESISYTDPNRTVAEMIIIRRKQASGEDVYDLENETERMTKTRLRSVGFTKAGWVPALKKLLSKVKGIFSSATISGVNRASFGGATPAQETFGEVFGSIYNDVNATGRDSAIVEANKQRGAQAGIDKVTKDMATYLERKLGIPADKFNRF